MERATDGADQAQARVEAARFIRIPFAVEEDGDVDVALAVGPALGMTAEDIHRNHPVRRLARKQCDEGVVEFDRRRHAPDCRMGNQIISAGPHSSS